MCGIFGLISKNNIDLPTAEGSLAKLKHRGPDDAGALLLIEDRFANFSLEFSGAETRQRLPHLDQSSVSKIFLGHTRLSILDLSFLGHQPYISNCGRYSMTYNGEVYNYRELAHKYRLNCVSNCDTEVVLKSFEKLGEKCVQEFIGMWSFGIFDREHNRLFLSRDPFGIKPVYYFFNGELFGFASEIKALLPYIDKHPNEYCIFNFLVNRLKEFSDQTFFKNIFQLEPGHNLWFSNHSIKIKKYYENPDSLDSVDSKALQSKFVESINLHTRSDVPMGLCLSGGIDSNVVASVIANSDDKDKLRSFSGIFQGFEYDESFYIKKAVHHYQLKNTMVSPDIGYIRKRLPDLIDVTDEPFRTIGLILPSMIYEEASKMDIKVMLGGQGADEIFGGYGAHSFFFLLELLKTGKAIQFLREMKALSNKKQNMLLIFLRKLASLIYNNSPLRKLRGSLSLYSRGKYNAEFLEENVDSDYFANRENQPNNFQNKLLHDFNVGLRDYLNCEDRTSMLHSVEGRVPFLNTEFVKYGLSIRFNEKIKGGVRKWVLRESFKNLLEPSVIQRRDKVGYVSPQLQWMRDLKHELSSYLDPKNSYIAMIFSSDTLEGLIRNLNATNQEVDDVFLWRALSLEMWYSRFFKNQKVVL